MPKEVIKGLSLTQPWATLVASGAKKIETRSWSTRYRGWIAIHASKGFPGWAKEQCNDEPFKSALKDCYSLAVSEWVDEDKYVIGYDALPLGAILAVGNLHKVGRIGRRSLANSVIVQGLELPIKDDELAFGDFTPGRFGWVITNIHLLPEPIPCKGLLGLWAPPIDVLEKLEDFIK